MTEDPEKVFAALTAAMGAPVLSAEESAAVLRLAKAVADAAERKFAPLSCYAAGLVIGAAGGEDRLARLGEIIDQVHSQPG